MDLKILTNDNRLQVGFTLFLVWLLAIWHFQKDPRLIQIILYPLLSVFCVALLDLLITKLRFNKWYLPTAAMVSGFLIGLILAPEEPMYVIIAASILVSFSKQFLAVGVRQHIFNPAAFGIMVVSLIFGTTVAWWGVSWGKLPLVILIPLMIRILWRLKRLPLPIGFLFVYFVYLVLSSSFESAITTLVDPTVFLFALVMLPEPMTSPITGYFKYTCGPIVAILAILITSFTKVQEIFLPSLLLVNLGSFAIIRASLKLKKKVQ